MRVDLVYSNLSPVEGEPSSNPRKPQRAGTAGDVDFSKILETMLKELGELKKEEGEKITRTRRQDLPQFIRSIERADDQFQTAMSFRKALLEAYRSAACRSGE